MRTRILEVIKSSLFFSRLAIWVSCIFFSFTPNGLTEDTADFDQVIRFTSSPNPVGSGARALGMGGAFIAICDDATAASWNPAGLVQLEKPELSVVYDYHKNDVSSHYAAFPDALTHDGGEVHSFNYISAAYPFTLLSRNMTASINYQHLYDFNNNSHRLSSDIKQSTIVGGEIPLETIHLEQSDYSLEGELWALSPALAIQITPSLSVGLALNFWNDALFDDEWRTDYKLYQRQFVNKRLVDFSDTKYIETYRFNGVNFHLGMLWNINRSVTLGAVFKSPFTADLNYTFKSVNRTPNKSEPDDPDNSGDDIDIISHAVSTEETLDMPMSMGLGIAFRFNDAWSVSGDIYRTWWEDYLLHPQSEEAFSPISGEVESESDIGNTTQVRVGSEYLIIRKNFIVPLRCGLFYDPEPKEGGVVDFWGASVGSGIVWKNIAFDLAFQYRTGDDVSLRVAEDTLTQERSTYTMYGSLIYYF